MCNLHLKCIELLVLLNDKRRKPIDRSDVVTIRVVTIECSDVVMIRAVPIEVVNVATS